MLFPKLIATSSSLFNKSTFLEKFRQKPKKCKKNTWFSLKNVNVNKYYETYGINGDIYFIYFDMYQIC